MATKKDSAPNKSKLLLQTLPNNIEAEQAVLGAVISDYDVAIDYVSNLAAEDFYLPAHQTVFASVQRLMRQSKPVDIVTISTDLSHENKLDEIGGVTMLTELIQSLPSTANVQYYVSILKRTSLLRKIIRRSSEIIQTAYAEEDADKVLAVAESLIYSISEKEDASGLLHISQSAVEVVNRLAEVYNTKEIRSGLKVGMHTLDNLTNGFMGGQMIVLAARPGCGKTSFSMNIVANLIRAQKEKVVAVFNLEMSAEELVQRLIANLSGIDSRTLQRGEESPDDLNKMWQAAALLNDSNVYIDDTAEITAEQIMSKCRRLKAQRGGLDLVLIDYLQLLSPSDRGASKYQQVTDMSRAVKIMAKELKVPVILLSQMSRSIDQRDDKTPKLSDLRESGAIEQDADIVMFLTQGDFEVFSADSEPIYLMVAKHRAGSTADLAFKWCKPTGTFTPVENIIKKAEDSEKSDKSESSVPKRAQVTDMPPEPDYAPAEADKVFTDDDGFYPTDAGAELPFDPVSDEMVPPMDDLSDPLAQLQNSAMAAPPDPSEE